MPLVTDLLTGFVKAEDLEPGVKFEGIVTDVKEFQEKEGITTKAVLVLADGQQIVLNVTRLRAMIRSYGPNSDTWIGKTILLFRGMTTFSGRDVPCTKLEPIIAARIAAAPAAAQPARVSRRRKAAALEAAATASPVGPDDPIPF